MGPERGWAFWSLFGAVRVPGTLSGTEPALMMPAVYGIGLLIAGRPHRVSQEIEIDIDSPQYAPAVISPRDSVRSRLCRQSGPWR